MNEFERADTTKPPDIPEPHRSLLAFLGDLWEQIDLARSDLGRYDMGRIVFDELQARITALALTVQLAAGLKQPPE